MKKNNIIFLSIGVLLPRKNYIRREEVKFDRTCCAFIKELCKECYAKIVICSIFTLKNDYEKTIEKFIDTNFINKENFHSDWKVDFPSIDICKTRKKAILEWLENHSNVDDFVILDNKKIDMGNAINIDPDIGITPNDFRRANRLLKNKQEFLF